MTTREALPPCCLYRAPADCRALVFGLVRSAVLLPNMIVVAPAAWFAVGRGGVS